MIKDLLKSAWYNATNNLVTPPETVNNKYAERTEYIIPHELMFAINDIDKYCDRHDMRGWLPAGISLWNYIKHEERKGNIHSGQSVLEFGAGSYSSTLTWSFEGYPITGIEYLENLVDKSLKILPEYSQLQKDPMKVIKGSYYPKEYVKERDAGMHTDIIALEREEMRGHGQGFIDEHFHPVCYKDVYQENNISMKDFDIFFAYMWHYQCPSVYDMFRKYARDDAVMLAIGPRHTEIAKKMGLKTSPGSHIIRK